MTEDTTSVVTLLQNLLHPKASDEATGGGIEFQPVECKESILSKVVYWKIDGENLIQIKESEFGSLSDEEAYLFKARLTHNTCERFIHWRGSKAAKGTSPLPPEVKNDPPVHRVCQWSEPPSFIRLFLGKMVVYSGRRQVFTLNPHLFIILGETYDELRLYEVPCWKKSLRSRACFFLIDNSKKKMFIWTGSKVSSCSKILLDGLKDNVMHNEIFSSSDSPLRIHTFEEGNESPEFLDIFLEKNESYFNFKDVSFTNTSPKLFYFHRITGSLDFIEIEDIFTNKNHLTKFPFLQSHLCTVSKPALFLLDALYKVWMWCSNSDIDMSKKINEEYVSDFQNVKYIGQEYSKNKGYSDPFTIITAENEPSEFTNMFPYWEYKL